MSHTTTARVIQAAHNNAVWCDTLCRTHGVPGAFLPSIWLNRQPPPPFYPNAVTLTDIRDQAAQLEGIRALLAAGIPGAWAVKDSFCALDLTPLGFQPLFEARWIYRPAKLPSPLRGSATVRWERVRSDAQLCAWEQAWQGDDAEPASAHHPRLFLPALLADAQVLVLAAYHQQQIVGGVIANCSGTVVGISNLFVPDQAAALLWPECVAAVLDHFPGLPLVGYESGAALAHAEAQGFEALPPLRVWQTV
jgi:hypothetical protein